MIRAFSSDCRTPLEVIKLSLESTKLLFPRNLVWITGTSKEDWWKEGIEFFTQNVEAVCIEQENRWDWWEGNRIPAALAEALWGSNSVITWLHDDLVLPDYPDFLSDYKDWLKSSSNCMLFTTLQCWGTPDQIRLNAPCCDRAHAFIAKEPVAWSRDGVFLPSNIKNSWQCPWPMRHLKHCFNSTLLKDRKNWMGRNEPRNWLEVPAVCTDYDPLRTWNEWKELFS